jgi:hypothetical protein
MSLTALLLVSDAERSRAMVHSLNSLSYDPQWYVLVFIHLSISLDGRSLFQYRLVVFHPLTLSAVS